MQVADTTESFAGGMRAHLSHGQAEQCWSSSTAVSMATNDVARLLIPSEVYQISPSAVYFNLIVSM